MYGRPGNDVARLVHCLSHVMRGLGPRIHDLLFCDAAKTWMPGIKPGMTNECTAVPRLGRTCSANPCLTCYGVVKPWMPATSAGMTLRIQPQPLNRHARA